MTLAEIAHSIHLYFAERNMPIDGLTVIINVDTPNVGAQLDYNVHREMAELSKSWSSNVLDVDTSKFEFHGVRFQIESPAHQ